MKRKIAALLVAMFAFAQPVAAQTSAQQQAVIEMQALLADAGGWAQEHAAILERAGAALTDVDAFVGILDSFAAGEIEADTAIARLEAWRDDALGAVAQSRTAAAHLREPPSLALLGPHGARLSAALHATRDSLLPTIDEIERLVLAMSDLGVSALRNPEGMSAAKERVLYEATIQFVRVDLARIEVVTASLSDDHPNQALMQATRYYYAAIIDVTQFAIDEMDGRGERTVLVATLRGHARNMQGELTRAEDLTARLRARFQALQGGPEVELSRFVLQMAETFPPAVRAYRSLAAHMEQAADALERGEAVVDVWADQSERDSPYLDEISRLEQVRAAMVANNNRTPL